jgi:hypothetical protein
MAPPNAGLEAEYSSAAVVTIEQVLRRAIEPAAFTGHGKGKFSSNAAW